MVSILLTAANQALVNALDQEGHPIWDFTHALPANKY